MLLKSYFKVLDLKQIHSWVNAPLFVIDFTAPCGDDWFQFSLPPTLGYFYNKSEYKQKN